MWNYLYSSLHFWKKDLLDDRLLGWHPTPVLSSGKSHGQRSLVGCSPWGRKESDTTERLHFHFSLSCIGEGNGNAIQCSYLENPRDRLTSMGSHRVGHDWNDLAAAAEYLKSTITLKSLKIFLHYYLAFTVAVEMLTVNPHIVTLQVEFLLWPRSLSYIPNFGCF